ncbi:GNAT family N-acetyltransferase [Corynebacterium bovis]|uniref:N-acetyltransferase n=2 Tax=Corynebacterium bovis TaxID=36808 RepID=A0A3R8PGL0_9CORY|nr:N-acetyltransferase [Corynebacterium bovis]MBB3116092.1 putative acetyltransferase [Corynebacterium bovis DSM 20582 = CIP 54.80]MDN8579498.1 N-acetyltransferase [Corynebacterium bovis]QQC47026.1 N-acetyltransferase [Corynebacterium bovis]RRO80532.1 N-acetyltransferase [Corynebacterium bovis]RRO81509.1 N-acetyltransferase [Corynebacterium bovis]
MECEVVVRPENDADAEAVRQAVTAAFADEGFSDGSEPDVVDALREAGALTVSLVAEAPDGSVAGYVALSPVTLSAEHPADLEEPLADTGEGDARPAVSPDGWYGFGPVAVVPDHQGRGLGGRLVTGALDRVRDVDPRARGVVVLGDPGYYNRFGFAHREGLTYPGAPVEMFQARFLDDDPSPRDTGYPTGTVSYHRAFATGV